MIRPKSILGIPAFRERRRRSASHALDSFKRTEVPPA